MTFVLNQLVMLVGVVGIICADILKTVKPDSSINDLATTVSSLGLAMIGYSVAMNADGSLALNIKTVLSFVAVSGIAVAKFLFNKVDRRFALLLFICAILLLGVVIGFGRSNLSYVLGILGAFLVILGVAILNPILKNGQGNYLISAGWMLMIAANGG